MKTSSAKAKGRKLQQHVRDLILDKFKTLEYDDVVSTSMGAGGEDVKLSPAARKLLPISIECKNNKKMAIYNYYKQAVENAKDYEPVLVIKQDRDKVLAVMELEHYLEILYELQEKKSNSKSVK